MYIQQMESEKNKNVLKKCCCDHCDDYLRKITQIQSGLSLLIVLNIQKYNVYPP